MMTSITMKKNKDKIVVVFRTQDKSNKIKLILILKTIFSKFGQSSIAKRLQVIKD